MFADLSRSPSLVKVSTFLGLFFATVILRLYPVLLDYPLARAFNDVATGRDLATEFAIAVTYPALQGVTIVSLIWYCWFSGINREMRAQIVNGAVAAVFAAFLAHLLQHALPTTPRPIVDPALQLHVPNAVGNTDVSGESPYSRSPGFPSERATMFAGLAIAILTARHNLGLLALAFTVGVESCRIYLGLHYPTDILGSVFLAAVMASLAQARWSLRLGIHLVRWEEVSAPTFYMCAFLVSYLLATAFQDIRDFSARLVG